MRKLFIFGLAGASCAAFSQENSLYQKADSYFPKNEIKVNVIYPFWGMAEISYERSLNAHSSVGMSVFTDFNSFKDSWFVSPYYRYYFGKKPSSGLYLEGQTVFAKSSDKNLFSAESSDGKMLFGVGLGAGYKLVLPKGWLFDANVSAGTFVNKGAGGYFRPGLSFGKRF